MQNTLKEVLATELLRSQVLLNRDGVGLRPELLWSLTTKFPAKTFDRMGGEYDFVPQCLWTPAPSSISDASQVTGYTYTFTQHETVYFQYVCRNSYNATPQEIDRVYLYQSQDSSDAEIRVYISNDGIEWELVKTSSFEPPLSEVLLGQTYECNLVMFVYKVTAKASAPYGQFTIYGAIPVFGTGFNEFDTVEEAGIGLRGANLVLQRESGGLVDGSGNAFTAAYPTEGALNIFTRPYAQDNAKARPAIYFGAFDLESSDRLEYQTVTVNGIVEYRVLNIPLVITVYGSNYAEAEYRRDVLRAKVRRILMNVKLNEYWNLLELSGNKQDSVETNIVSGSGGAGSTGIWEAIAIIPVMLHYKLEAYGDLLP